MKIAWVKPQPPKVNFRPYDTKFSTQESTLPQFSEQVISSPLSLFYILVTTLLLKEMVSVWGMYSPNDPFTCHKYITAFF